MESDDDFQLLSSPEVASPQVSRRKLKRLKKASTVSEDFFRIDNQSTGRPSMPELNSSESEADDSNKLNVQDLDVFNDLRQSEPGSRDFSDGDNSGPSLGLDDEDNNSTVKKALEFDSMTEINEEPEDQFPANGEESMDPVTDELEKKRHNLDAMEEERETKKRKSKKKRSERSGDGDSYNETTTNKRVLEKERRQYVELLRAESQRLLRETRGAEFKPLPVVEKPISSVLEKIRQRKLELSRKSAISENTILDDDDGDNLSTEVMMKHDSDANGRENVLEKECEDVVQHPGDVESQKDPMYVDGCSDDTILAGSGRTPSERTADEIKEAFRAPIDDTQELFSDSQISDNDDLLNNKTGSPLREKFTPSVLAMNLMLDAPPLDDLLNEPSSSRLQEKFTPSILAMNLKLDSAAFDDVSDDEEEDNDKENVNPHPHGLSNGDPVKAFVDDEADEEDDSDHDLRFQDEEEDEDTDAEELHDMIATAYEEDPIDSERRNELHQKWLEQQDAAGTENLLQKLKYGSKLRKSTSLEDENEGDIDDQDFGDAAAEDLLPLDVARMNIRKVKLMLPQMFTDKDDQYMSDDDETERTLANERMFDKAAGKSTFLSPADDESCREVFGLIKKLNVVSDIKKRQKAPSILDPPLTGESKNTSSKSFIGRSSNLSHSSSHKHGSSNSRSFVFGRDDSNSSSAIATTEEPSNSGQNENKATRIASAKFSYSQGRSGSQNSAPETNSGTSLFDILRQSSLQVQLQRKQCTLSDVSSQTSSVFASFKLEKTHIKKPIKTEGRL